MIMGASTGKGLSWLFQFILLFSLVSCNLPASIASNPGPSGTEGTPADGQVTPQAELPPGDLVEYYNQKVENGEWTQEEGLIFFLKAALGDAPLDIPESVVEFEINGLIVLAHQYLQTGTNEAAKAEIKQLLERLFPSEEKLEAVSIPESEARNSAAKLASPSMQAADCASFWRDGLIPDATTYPCFMWGEESVAGISHRVYFPTDWRGDTDKYAYYEAAREAARLATNTYSGLGTMPRVYIVFAYDLNWGAPDPTRAFLGTNFFGAGEPCGVAVFPASIGMDIGTFKQAVAHELFHCFTVKNIYEHRSVNYLTNMWWIEGGADYFSNVVYPEVDAEYRYIQNLNEESLTTPLYRLGYRNFLFFQHMGNQSGDEKIIELMKSMPLNGSYNDQLAAIVAYPGMIDLYESYARAFLGNRIADTSGIIYPYTPVFARTTLFPNTQVGDLPYRPFVLYREKFTYEPEMEYTFRTDASRDVVRIATAPIEFAAWQNPSWVVDASCNQWEYMTYSIGITTNTSGGLAEYTVSGVEMAGGIPCEQCLIGTWKLEPNSYIVYANSLFPPSMGVARAVGYNGEMLVEYNDSGKTMSTYNNFAVYYKGKFPDPNGGPPIQSNLEIKFLPTGTAVGYSASESLITYSGARARIQAKGEMAIPGEGSFPITVNTDAIPGGGMPISENYVCKGNFLAVIPNLPPSVPNVPEPIVFIRFLPPSP